MSEESKEFDIKVISSEILKPSSSTPSDREKVPNAISMSEESKEFDIKVISSEILKPSSPTPTDRKTDTLSFLDQVSDPIHAYTLLCYTSYKNSKCSSTNVEPQSDIIDAIISNLKACLSETLTHFYPFAGRCENESIVSCNDQGTQFNVAHVASDLSALLCSPEKLNLLPKLVPREGNAHFFKGPQPISDVVTVAFQINVFQCGGIVIGTYSLHKLMDFASWANFLKYWATLANKNRKKEDLIEPDFEAAAKAFPPSPKVERVLTMRSVDEIISCMKSLSAINVMVKSFFVDKNAISELKVKATSEKLSPPTRFEAVAAFVWPHALAAACSVGAVNTENDKEVKSTQLNVFADVRGRTCPPLPRATIGNLITHATAKAEQTIVTFSDLAVEIHAAVLRLKSRYEGTLGESRTEALMAERAAGANDLMYKPGSYNLSSWCLCLG